MIKHQLTSINHHKIDGLSLVWSLCWASTKVAPGALTDHGQRQARPQRRDFLALFRSQPVGDGR